MDQSADRRLGQEELREVLARLPGWRARDCRVEGRLVGLTNRCYRVMRQGEAYAVRLSSCHDDALLGIDRVGEKQALRVAAELGIGPEVEALFLPEGHLVTRWVEGELLSFEQLRSEEFMLRLVEVLKRVHAARGVESVYSPFGLIEHYAGRLGELDEALGAKLTPLLEQARRLGDLMRREPVPLVFCHNDLCRRNLLVGERLRLIDWEYAAMNDPLFDLANFAQNVDLDAGQELLLLRAYWGEAALREERLARFGRMKFVSVVLVALWFLARLKGDERYFRSFEEVGGAFSIRTHLGRLALEGLERAEQLMSQL